MAEVVSNDDVMCFLCSEPIKCCLRQHWKTCKYLVKTKCVLCGQLVQDKKWSENNELCVDYKILTMNVS